MRDAFVLDYVRTPFGTYSGGHAGVRPDDLAAATIDALVGRHPSLLEAPIDDVLFGDANGAGEDNRNVARMAALLAGLPTSVSGATVNRLCASGLQALIDGSRAIETGDASLLIVGGVESMSRAPWVLEKPPRGFPRSDTTLHSTTLGWRMVNPKMPARWTIPLGAACEALGQRYDVSRDEQDRFALRSHRRALEAWEHGLRADHIVTIPPPGRGPRPEPELTIDESIRPDTSLSSLAALAPAFSPDGTVTAGNSSPLSDGAAALIIGDASAAERLGIEPLVRIAGRGVAAVDPDEFGLGPVPASARALARAGIGLDDLGAVELNEAFAAQVLSCLREWPDLDPDLVNQRGGAIAIGHPLGASGARLAGDLAVLQRDTGTRWGLAALCIGVGQGAAVVFESPRTSCG